MSLMYLSRIWISAADNWRIRGDIDGSGTLTSTAIPEGYYYLSSPSASESLISAIDTLWEATFPGAEAVTITFSTTTGKVSFQAPTLGASWSLSFLSSGPSATAFEEWMGFGTTHGWSNVVGATQTSDVVCQGVIVANGDKEDYEDLPLEFGFNVERPISGTPCVTGTGREIVMAKWSHRFEPNGYVSSPLASGTWNPSRTSYDPNDNVEVDQWAWQDFWRHHAKGAQAGQPFRVYELGAAIADYEGEFVLMNGKKFAPKPTEPSSRTYWTVNIDAASYESA